MSLPKKNYLTAKIAAGSAVISVIILSLNQLSDLGLALQNFSAIWLKKESLNESIDPKNIGIYEKITEEKRRNNLSVIVNFLNRQNTAVIGLAYYRIEMNSFGSVTLKYHQDSEVYNGEQTYFRDKKLNMGQYETLKQLDCFITKDLGNLVDRRNIPIFPAIVCPTIYQETDRSGISRFLLANATAIAIDPSVIKPENLTLEPYATILFQLSPSFESLNNFN